MFPTDGGRPNCQPARAGVPAADSWSAASCRLLAAVVDRERLRVEVDVALDHLVEHVALPAVLNLVHLGADRVGRVALLEEYRELPEDGALVIVRRVLVVGDEVHRHASLGDLAPQERRVDFRVHVVAPETGPAEAGDGHGRVDVRGLFGLEAAHGLEPAGARGVVRLVLGHLFLVAFGRERTGPVLERDAEPERPVPHPAELVIGDHRHDLAVEDARVGPRLQDHLFESAAALVGQCFPGREYQNSRLVLHGPCPSVGGRLVSSRASRRLFLYS